MSSFFFISTIIVFFYEHLFAFSYCNDIFYLFWEFKHSQNVSFKQKHEPTIIKEQRRDAKLGLQ